MKFIFLSFVITATLTNPCYGMDDVIDLLKGSKELSGFTISRTNKEVTFKSKDTLNLPQFNGHFNSAAILGKECSNDEETQTLQDVSR